MDHNSWLRHVLYCFIIHLLASSFFHPFPILWSSKNHCPLAPGQLRSQLLSPALLWESAWRTGARRTNMGWFCVPARFIMVDLWLTVRFNWSESHYIITYNYHILPYITICICCCELQGRTHSLQHFVFAGPRVLRRNISIIIQPDKTRSSFTMLHPSISNHGNKRPIGISHVGCQKTWWGQMGHVTSCDRWENNKQSSAKQVTLWSTNSLLWIIIICNGKINYKWPFSKAMLNYQRVTFCQMWRYICAN